MIADALNRLKYLTEIIPNLIAGISEADMSYKPAPEKWSKKEILGHLADSAANNHQRFIRMQYENVPMIVYDQNEWNRLNHYNNMDSSRILRFWTEYNRHIAAVIGNIPAQSLLIECTRPDGSKVTLAWLITDYVEHMEHHLKAIVNY